MSRIPFDTFPNRQIAISNPYNPQNPFHQVHQMMRIGFPDDLFVNQYMMPYGGDPFEKMLNFSNTHKKIHEQGHQGSFVSQSFVSSTKIGPDGKVFTENYYENNLGQHKNGHTISQSQQAYKNNEGVNRIAEQRMLNEKGRKIVRQKFGQNIEQTNHYLNIDEEQKQKFDTEWKNTNANLKFLQRHVPQLSIGQPIGITTRTNIERINESNLQLKNHLSQNYLQRQNNNILAITPSQRYIAQKSVPAHQHKNGQRKVYYPSIQQEERYNQPLYPSHNFQTRIQYVDRPSYKIIVQTPPQRINTNSNWNNINANNYPGK